MSLKSTSFADGALILLEVKGSLVGGDETDELRNTIADLVEQGNKKLVLDLSKVTYLNSTAIGVLVSAHSKYSRIGGKVTLCGINDNIDNIFVITKLTLVFDIAETQDDAIKSLS